MQEIVSPLSAGANAPSRNPVMPPPPPQGSDPATVMAWMQQMLPIFQKMQQPQPGCHRKWWCSRRRSRRSIRWRVMTQTFEMFREMQRSVQPPQQPYRDPSGQYAAWSRRRPWTQGPYGGPRPYYSGPAGSAWIPPGQGYPPQQSSQRPKTAAEEFGTPLRLSGHGRSIADRFRPQAAEPDDRDRDRGRRDDRRRRQSSEGHGRRRFQARRRQRGRLRAQVGDRRREHGAPC